MRASDRRDDLRYCKLGFTGHVHAAKVSAENWAKGVLAIDMLGRSSMATTTPKLSPKNRRAAEKILNHSQLRKRGEMSVLTRDQVQEALINCPTHRKDIRDGLWMILHHIKRGMEVKDNAPVWIQAQNAIFVSSIDNGSEDDD